MATIRERLTCKLLGKDLISSQKVVK